VNEQSEHLSSAQIENYGNRSSGAGPDADQPNEAVRINAHLESCPSCRNRLLDFHRASFGLLAEPQQLADVQVNTASTPDCPSDDALRQLAAGLSLNDLATSDALATKLIQHAATCDHCGPLLRTFTEDFSDDFTPEEQAALANLQSSSNAWQKNTVREMMKAGAVSGAGASGSESIEPAAPMINSQSSPRKSPARPTAGRKPFSWKWILIPATAAVVAMAAFSIWYTQRNTPEKVEKLLAQAYTEQRTMEMRWPGATYSALSPQERGNLGHQPASLFQAKSIILDHLSAHKDDAKWLHALGREEILEWRTEEALNDLKHALELSPNSAPIMVDLAIAHFQRAERSQNVIDYAEAVELLGKALAIKPDDPNTLFNRALLYQRMSPPLYESALNDWNHFLAIEPHGPWSDEARRHKHEIEELKKNSSATN